MRIVWWFLGLGVLILGTIECRHICGGTPDHWVAPVEWVGSPAVSTGRDWENFPIGFLVGHEFGLRHDGVVVWRRVTSNGEAAGDGEKE